MLQASYEDFISLLIVRLVVTRFGSCRTEATVDTLSSGELVVLNTFSCESLIVASSSPNEDTILELSSKNRMSSHTTGVRSQDRG